MNEHIENSIRAILGEIHEATEDVEDVNDAVQTVTTLSRSLEHLRETEALNVLPPSYAPPPEENVEVAEGGDAESESDAPVVDQTVPDGPGEDEEPKTSIPDNTKAEVEESDEAEEKEAEEEPATADEAEDELDDLWNEIAGG